MDRSSITPTPQQLRALTHPARLRMLGILRTDGPSTATALARQLGLNTGATSYHLRQLAQHGFITDDAERGNGRERWWRAAQGSTRAKPPEAPDGADRDAYDAYLQSVAVVYADTMQRALEERPQLPEEWSRASTMSDWRVRLTPGRAEALLEHLVAAIEATEDEDEPGVATWAIQIAAFPQPGQNLDQGVGEPS